MSSIIVSLDIGSSVVRAVIAERLDTGVLQIVGVGSAPSTGMRRGAVVNLSETVRSIHEAIEGAEMMSGIEITHCSVGIGGVNIEGINSKGVSAVTSKGKGNKEIDETDIDRVISTAIALDMPSDRQIIHVVPQFYTVDEQSMIKDPRNRMGVRLEVIVHIITGSSTCIQNIISSVRRASLAVDSYMYQGLAAIRAVMTEEEQMLGSVLIDIGGGTTDVVVVKNGAPILTHVFPVGGNQLTGDIEQVKRISKEAAEKIKIEEGCCWLPMIEEDKEILLPAPGGRSPIQIQRSEVCEILQMRMSEILLLIKNKISKMISEHGFGGSIILCGGGSLIPGTAELANEIFNTKAVRLGVPPELGGLGGEYQSPEFAAVMGLLLAQNEQEVRRQTGSKNKSGALNSFMDTLKKIFKDAF